MTNRSDEQDRKDASVTIFIVNYRTADLVIDCLSSLAVPQTVPDGTQIVVVDGASDDGSVEKLTRAIQKHGWSNVSCLPLHYNGGFAYANNRGIRYAETQFGKTRYSILLNPDTIARPGSITRLVEFMERHPQVGIAGSALEHLDGRPQACAFRFPSIAAELESEARLGPLSHLLDRWRIAPDMSELPVQIDWVSGACMVVRAEVMQELKGLDENYFLYYEEVDFCRRAMAAGWPCWHVPGSRVVHLVGQSTGVTRHQRPARRPTYWFSSRRRYYVRHHGTLYAMGADLAWLGGHLIWRLRLIIERRTAELTPKLLRDFLRNMFKSHRII